MITLVCPFYLNSGMLALQYQGWAAWPDALRSRLRVIIVDDGSPEPAIDVPRPDGLQIEIYRVLEDRPWHQHGARNLGAHMAPEGWMLLTDMDHVLTVKNAQALFDRLPRLNEKAIYTLHRVEADTGLPTLGKNFRPKPHPNSFVLTREMFWKIGGYDEEFEGYGTDGQFKGRAFSIAEKRHLTKVALSRYSREIVADASTTTMGRKEPGWRCDTAGVKAKKAAEGREKEILTLDFPWERAL